MMNQRVIGVMAVAAGVVLAWTASGRLGYPVLADEVGFPAGAPLEATTGGHPMSGLQAAYTGLAAPVGEAHAAFEWPAGVEYRFSGTSVEAFKASLAPLWTWQGDDGTYGDGQTRVRVLAQEGRVAGVEILHNATIVADGCLEAQLLYGVSVDGAGVASACAGIWTRQWAEAQGAQTAQGR